MHDFSLFILTNLLPIGLATNVFLLIGLLIAKFIWGRYTQRLNFAVEENLNLASQWSALGVSQRDLFKKLRSRWEADRDAWESRLSEVEGQVLVRENRIAQLTAELKGKGRGVPADPGENHLFQEELKKLKAALSEKEAEIADLKAEENRSVPVSPLLPLSASHSESDENQRIQELEQDLIDTHDELHRVREDNLKQVELVESLEARLINAEQESAVKQDDVTEEGESFAQMSALLARRSAELLGFRNEIQTLKIQNSRLREEVADTAKLEELQQSLEEKKAELDAQKDVFATYKEEQAKEMEKLEAERKEIVRAKNEELEEEKSKQSEQRIAIESLEKKVDERDAELKEMRSKIAELEVLNGRRASLQIELNDAHHEMYDVRNALNERLDEIELLEARLDELDLVEDEAHALANELKDTRHELSDVRIALNAKSAERDQLAGQMEELEAIIEDRSAEVNDLSSEVRQQRDEIRSLKNTLAEKEGELEALTEESGTFTVSLNAKDAFVDEQAVRIADLEQSLADRYHELNEVRRQVGDGDRAAEHHKARADQLEAELERRLSAFEESDQRIAEAEDEIEIANAKIANLTEQLSESEKSIAELEEQLSDLSRDKEETLRNLNHANKRVEDLERAAKERQETILKLEQEKREISQESGSLQRKVDSLNVEIDEANRHREEARVTLAELESVLVESDEKTLKLSREIEEKDSQLEQLKQDVKNLEGSLSEREVEIEEAVSSTRKLEEELEQAREEAAGNRELLAAKRAGIATDEHEKIEKLEQELTKREEEVEQYVAQQSQSVAQIEELRNKIAKRGDTIRNLKAEISNIMLQRSDRDNEIALLKEKLRSAEASVDVTSASATFDQAIQQSLASRSDEAGTSLDELEEETESHHDLKQEDASPVEKTHTEESAMDDDAVYFDEGSYSLTDRAIGRIDQLAGELRRGRSRASVAVIAYSGAEGSAAFNETLSAKRADSVRERLLERGVPRSMISVESSGQDRRFSDWRARRAELVLVPNAVAESVN